MQVAIVAVFFAASAIQHCIAGKPRALRSSAPPSVHEMLLQDSLGTRAAGVHDERHLETHMHKRAAKISLMTIASERGPTTAHRGGPHHNTTDNDGQVHLEEARFSKVERHEAHSLHAEHRRGSHSSSVSHDEASDDNISADVVVNVDAKDATSKANDESQVAAKIDSSLDSDGSAVGAVAYDSDATDGSEARVKGESSNVVAAEDREAAAIYHTIAKAHAEDTDETVADADMVDSVESEAEIEATAGSTDTDRTVDSEVASSDAEKVSSGSDSKHSVDTAVASQTENAARGDLSADADTTKEGIVGNDAQPADDSTGADAGLPGQMPGQDGEVVPETTPSDEGDGARTEPGSDPGSLNVGSSVMQAESVGPADSYHDGSTESEDWGKEYGAAAQAFHDKVEARESQSAAPHQSTTAADVGGSGSMALIVGLIIILGLLACVLGLGTKI